MTAHILRNGSGVTADQVYQILMATNQYAIPPWTRRRMALDGDGNSFDWDRECGYPIDPHVYYYHQLYLRGGIAARVVDIWPDECWAAFPELYETEQARHTRFERTWEELQEKLLVWHYLHRGDRLSGKGRFGVILLGLNDGRDLREPARNIDSVTGKGVDNPKEQELLYLRVFDETQAIISAWENDRYSPRYGLPTQYNIKFADVESFMGGLNAPMQIVDSPVHWSRVHHMADNLMSSEVFGIPRMTPVLNLIHDILKVQGGSAEMFRKGGFPGYAFEAFPNELGILDVDLPSIRKEIDAYSQGYQRYLTSQGGKWNSLAVQVANPKNHIEQYLNLLSSTIGVPTRILMGTEAGHLASTQDAGAWKDRLRGRQKNYLEPRIVRPFVNRLVDLGVLPRVKKYLLSWRDLRALSDKDRVEVSLKQVQAMMQYQTGNVNQLMPRRLLWTMILGMTEQQADAIEAELAKNPPPPVPVTTIPPITSPAGKSGKTQGGGRKGNPNKKPVGRRPNGPPDKNTNP